MLLAGSSLLYLPPPLFPLPSLYLHYYFIPPAPASLFLLCCLFLLACSLPSTFYPYKPRNLQFHVRCTGCYLCALLAHEVNQRFTRACGNNLAAQFITLITRQSSRNRSAFCACPQLHTKSSGPNNPNNPNNPTTVAL